MEREENFEAGYEAGHQSGLDEGHKTGLAEGHKTGLAEGEKAGQQKLFRLFQKMSTDGLENEAARLLTEPDFLDEMLKKYQL